MDSSPPLICRVSAVILLLVAGRASSAEVSPQSAESKASSDVLTWQRSPRLPPIKDVQGLAGAFIGVDQEALILAGGSNFDKPAWDGGTKRYQSPIHVLARSDNPNADFKWYDGGNLSVGLADGIAVSTRWGVVCIGGHDGHRCQDKVFALQWQPREQSITLSDNWPPLPVACEKASATVTRSALATKIYLAGGRTQDHQELQSFYCLTIPHDAGPSQFARLQWRELPTWPGVPRFGAALVTQHDGSGEKLYLLGGKHKNTYLNDAYCFDPIANEWRSVAPLPRPALLAPTLPVGQSHILLFAGSDGHDVDRWQQLRDDYHFVNDVLAYHTITDTWTNAGTMPTGVAATTAVAWQDGLLIPGGELRPSVRSRELQFAKLRNDHTHFGAVNLGVMALYLMGLLAIGLYCSKSENSTNDYFLAGGRIPWWAAGLSLLATQVSSIGFLAIPAKSFATNWTYFAGVLTWFLVVPIVTRVYIPFVRSLNVTTAYEYLEVRFNYATRLLAALAFSLLQLGRMGVVLLLPALALVAVTGMDVITCIVIMGVVATIYTVAGGMEAVVWTDVMQAVVLLCGAMVCVVAVVMQTPGGWVEVWQQAQSDGKLQLANLDYDPTLPVLWVIIVGNILTRLSGLTADQTVVQRYLSTSNASTASRALWLDVAVSIPWAIVVFGMGTTFYVFYKNNPELLSPAVANDAIVPLFIAHQLPVGIAGIVVAAVFAAAMSSLDSSMHSVATVYVNDFHIRLWPHSTEHQRLKLARRVTAALGCFGTGMAIYMATAGVLSLWDAFLAIVGAVAGVLAGLFLLGMFTTRANGAGAIVGAFVGAVATFAAERYTGVSFFLYPVFGIGGCFVAGYVTSLLVPGQSRVAGLTVFTRTSSVPT